MSPFSRPTALINLAALVHNYELLRDKAAPAETGAVIKANAYGLGAAPVAKALASAGCRTFFTAQFAEAMELRGILPKTAIVVLHGLAEQEYAEAEKNRLIPVINHLGALESWQSYARKTGKKLPAFIHLDTGINRLGLPLAEQEALANDPSRLEGLSLKGWLSHFSCSSEFDNPITPEQRERFVRALETLPPAPASLSNSSGIFWGPDFLFDLVRPGLALFGGNPTPHRANPMRAVLELQAPVLQVRDVDTSMTVGYGATHRFARRGRVATLAIGYADGYHHSLGNKGIVKIGPHFAPLVGHVSMDSITVDVTDLPESDVHVGALATVLGPHRTLDALAAEAGTITYEILTSLGSRLLRTYHNTSVT